MLIHWNPRNKLLEKEGEEYKMKQEKVVKTIYMAVCVCEREIGRATSKQNNDRLLGGGVTHKRDGHNKVVKDMMCNRMKEKESAS